MKQAFIDRSFRRDTIDVITKANSIIEEYTAEGYSLTLRQLYYQFVARALLDNKQSEYKRLGSIINDARLAGLIDWNAIEDRTRNLSKPTAWQSPEEIISTVAAQYKEDLWRDQPYHLEVWVEKEALAGVVETACEPYRVGYFSCRGYVSQSEQYEAGRRFASKVRRGKEVLVLHLGDHDPSGLDMTRDNRDRLHLFGSPEIRVKRIALNMDQIDEYAPPPNPAKETDARFEGYRQEHGDESWELDALDPRTLTALISAEIDKVISHGRWNDALDQETKNRNLLAKTASRWDEVRDMMGDLNDE